MNQVPKISGAGYNWREQWYPVSFARDLPEGQPQRVWLFDEAIMVLRRPGRPYLLNGKFSKSFIELNADNAHVTAFIAGTMFSMSF